MRKEKHTTMNRDPFHMKFFLQMHGTEIFLILVHFIKIVFFFTLLYEHKDQSLVKSLKGDRYTSFVNQQQLFSSVRSASVNQNEIELL